MIVPPFLPAVSSTGSRAAALLRTRAVQLGPARQAWRHACTALIAAAAWMLAGAPMHAAAPSSATPARVKLHGSIRTESAAAGTAGDGSLRGTVRANLTAAENDEALTFEVALAVRNFAELEQRVARSEVLTAAELESRYLPLAGDQDRIAEWLRAEGLTLSRRDPSHLAVMARGRVRDVARVLQVSFGRVRAHGMERTSALTAPSIPAHLAGAVRGIHGLQPVFRRPATTLQPRATAEPPFTAAQIKQAYFAANMGDGIGETIAVYGFSFPDNADLTQFGAMMGVRPATVDNVPVGFGPLTGTSVDFQQEATLDVEWSCAMAPGARIRMYGAYWLDPLADDEIIQQLLADLPTHPGLHQLVIAYGTDENTLSRDYLAIAAQNMALLAASGVTVFASSGDSGALGLHGTVQVSYPACIPTATSVGGTRLAMDTSGNVRSETAWGSSADDGTSGGSGGGASSFFSRPIWQVGLGVPAGTTRLVPDVAAVGDPKSGLTVVFGGKSLVFGGTSVSAPLWAGWGALLNQARVTAGKPPLGALNPRLYPLNDTMVFRDITGGGNALYRAGPGYDLCTGLGAPNVASLSRATLADAYGPEILAQTGSRFTTFGRTASFLVVADGRPAVSYRWQRRAAASSDWTNLSEGPTYAGTASATLFVQGCLLTMNGDQFQCVVSNAGGSVTSQPAKLTVAGTGVSTIAGWPRTAGSANGTTAIARFNYISGVRVDADENLYLADHSNHLIRKISPDGVVTTVAGVAGSAGYRDGPADSALFHNPESLAIDADGNVYVADSFNYVIRKISSNGSVSTLAGQAGKSGRSDGTGTAAQFYYPCGLALDQAGNLYVADGRGNTVRKMTPAGVVTTLAGSGTQGAVDGTGSAAQFNNVTSVALDQDGNVYAADEANHAVRKITPDGVVTTLAGLAGPKNQGYVDGTGTAARFSYPSAVATDPARNVYVAELVNNTIRKITPAGVVTTVAGGTQADYQDGAPGDARFSAPLDLTVDAAGNIYVADTGNCTVRQIALGPLLPPTTAVGPVASTANAGQTARFAVKTDGAPPFIYQWQELANGAKAWTDLADSTDASGTHSAVLTLAAASAGRDGSQFRCILQNAAGSVTSSAGTLVVVTPPTIATVAQTRSIQAGDVAAIAVDATGHGLAYQWQLNGTNLAGATNATLSFAGFRAANAGTYGVVVTNSAGSISKIVGTLNLGAYLANLSVRAAVGTGPDVLIVGFFVTGTAPSPALLRGAGPVLGQFGLTDALANPVLTLSNSSGASIATNRGWSNDASLAAAFSRVGAFAFPAGSADAAMLQPLAPGLYSAQLAGDARGSGVALAELYDTGAGAAAARFTNISARTNVGVGSDILIVGFVVGGSGSEKLLIRGIGPTLGSFGVTGALAQPVLSVLDATGKTVATNAGWASDPNLASAFGQVGAFPLGAGLGGCGADRDAAGGRIQRFVERRRREQRGGPHRAL